MNLASLKQDLHQKASPEKVAIYQRFFKTGSGEYGEGDVFIGVTVPDTRLVAKAHRNLSIDHLSDLITSPIHEERLCALMILRMQYEQANKKSNTKGLKKVVDFYLNNTRYINNWDLVDSSAEYILGAHLMKRDRSILYKLSASSSLWERRISMMSTFHFIKNKDFNDTLKIAKILLADKHDLIHKAVGWMLREIGKRDLNVEEQFLKKYGPIMPRTMLRYAIEKFPNEKRRVYLYQFAFKKPNPAGGTVWGPRGPLPQHRPCGARKRSRGVNTVPGPAA